MNLELDEEYGAGFEGTKALLYKYLKDTPGQKIIKYMDKTNKELEESITAENVEKITGAQIEKYIDAQNFKALEHITKFLSADEYELWSKNGFEGRTFELLMKQRAKNVKESTELEEDMVDMLIQKFRDSGRVAVRYPRKKLISVSGRSMPEKDAIETMKRILDKEAGVKEAVEKIACLKCDEVSTAAAWQKNKGFCPVCKTSSQGVAESEELQEMQELYAVVDENDVVLATASNELAAKRSISSSELPPLSVKDKSKLRIVKTRKTAQVGAPLKEHIDLQTLRTMKIVSLATGCTDSAALYEYALTSPSYTSLVELKENFNKYIQEA